MIGIAALLERLTIRGKLTALSIAAAGAAIVLASAALFAYEGWTFRDVLLRTLAPQADIVGRNAASAIVFQDRKAASDTLAALRAEPHVVVARIYDRDGRVFAEYAREGTPLAEVVPARAQETLYDHHEFTSDQLMIVRMIKADGERVGAVVVRADLLEIQDRLTRLGAIAAGAGLLSFGLALLLAARIQRVISTPVVRLAEVARRVSIEEDLGVRTHGGGARDEIGLLVGTFNDMLDRLQARDLEVLRARADLERRVEERTRDLTQEVAERRRLEERLRAQNVQLELQNRRVEEASRMKSEFLANMSHELRTPLNAIIGFSELMSDELAGPITAQQRDYHDHVLASARHLLQLINDVLDLAKVEAGKIELRPEPVDPAEVVHEVRDMLRTLAATRRVSVEAEVDPSLGTLHIDPAKLKQVLYNFLSNALKFTHEGGRVVVRARPEGAAEFRLEVEDDGIGIKAEDIPRLFVEFQQLDAGAAKKFSGTGLGLALTKRLVTAQGGRVGVESEPGKGSTFFAVLPREAHGMLAPEAEALAATPRPPSRPGTARILVVEDDPSDRDWLERTLSEAGYAVDAVGKGAEAIQRAKERRYDAVTLDLLLPDIAGRDVLRAMRAEGPNRETPAIVVTVVSEREAGAGFAVDDFLVKPVGQEELLEALRRARVLPHGSRPVLVVDDDPGSLALMAATLQELGYRAVPASSGQAGLEAAERDPPAAVVLDLLMPGMGGLEFLERFRAQPGGRETPVVIWSVKELTPEERARVRESAQGVISKGQGGAASLLEELRALLGPARAGGGPVAEAG